MMKQSTSSLLLGLISIFTLMTQAQACLDQGALTQLKTAELTYLVSRNVPTMTHALQDNIFTIQVTQGEDATDCHAVITYQLPETDITEANQILNNSPGKRIMLAGQGYQLPETNQIRANVKVNVSKINSTQLSFDHEDVLQSAPLGRNRASVELMYATLIQSRAIVMTNTLNTQPWPYELIEVQKSTCKTNYSSDAPMSEACDCRVRSLSERLSPRQLSYIQYLASDPYSSATGALASYNSLSEQINFSCKLSRR